MNSMTNPSIAERVQSLTTLSDKIYPAIDELVGGERRSRRIVRVGIGAVAHHMKQKSDIHAGAIYQRVLVEHLERGGITLGAYQDWPAYWPSPKILPNLDHVRRTGLDELANRYSDVERATRSSDETLETNASHVVHLSALALPYAAEFHPELDLNKIALYCLIHDILEAYTGDVATLGISEENMAQKRDDEAKALNLFGAQYGLSWPQFVQVVRDYEESVDDEAKFVRTFDKLDPSFTHFTNKGTQLMEHYGYKSSAEFLAATDLSTPGYLSFASGFPDLLEIRQQLLQRVADHVVWPDNN